MSAHGPRRVLLYAHDTYGLGHLRRNLAIARRLLEDRPRMRIVLASGSPVLSSFSLPRGLSVVALPPVEKVGAEEYQPLDRRLDIDLVRRARSAVIADVARRFAPDVFLVDHAPHGMKGELLPVFDVLQRWCPATRIVLGLRDVLDDPGVVRQLWQEQGVYETLKMVYDRILVYGSADVFDVRREYAMPPPVAARTSFCGYLCPASLRAVPTPELAPDGPFVLGTAGGGGDGLAVLTATLAASRELGVGCLLVTGPLMAPAQRRRLVELAANVPGASVVEFVPDLADVMAGARAVVTMGGYNSLCELVGLRAPTVVVPRVSPRREQAIRAELFASRGLVRVALPGLGLAERLARELSQAIASPERKPVHLDLGGLSRLAGLLEGEAAGAGSGIGVAPWVRQRRIPEERVSA